MNIKPTQAQVREWVEGAGKYADMKRKTWEAWDLLRDQKLAELAAQWGAAQAQQTTEPEAWSIPEWSKQDDLGGRVPSDVRVALNEAHRAGVRAGAAGSQDAKLHNGFVLVPLVMSRAMEEVVQQEDWEWADLLAAAEAVTEEQYNAAMKEQQ